MKDLRKTKKNYLTSTDLQNQGPPVNSHGPYITAIEFYLL